MNRFDALDRSRAAFDRSLRAVDPDHWPLPTPCTDWNVRDLVNHVVGGCRRYTLLLHGARPEQTNALRALDHLGADPVTAFAEAFAEMTAAFREPGALDRIVHHPAGDRSGAALLDLRIMDCAIHAWDLAVAVGSDPGMDLELLAVVWEILAVIAPKMVEQGYFAATPQQSWDDVPLQTRILHVAGRRP